MSEVLRCEALTKKYGKLTALNAVDLTLESGKIIGLLGPNGSGKTTLIKLINGLLTPSSGSITVCGFKPGAESKAFVSYLPDVNYLSDNMTIQGAIRLFEDFYKDFQPQRAYEMLQKLQLTPKSKLKALSKGNKEKVALILVMSRDAKLYVLDEPIAGVDPAARDYIISTIINNYSPESSVIISTHLIADIEQVLDEVIFLKNGNIEMHKSVDDIRQEHAMSVDDLFRDVYKW